MLSAKERDIYNSIYCQTLLIIHLFAWFKVRVCERSRPLQKLLHMAPSTIPIAAAANIHCHSGEENPIASFEMIFIQEINLIKK